VSSFVKKSFHYSHVGVAKGVGDDSNAHLASLWRGNDHSLQAQGFVWSEGNHGLALDGLKRRLRRPLRLGEKKKKNKHKQNKD
jgi:hypothetical protein